VVQETNYFKRLCGGESIFTLAYTTWHNCLRFAFVHAPCGILNCKPLIRLCSTFPVCTTYRVCTAFIVILGILSCHMKYFL
jgi:hypothetical protein